MVSIIIVLSYFVMKMITFISQSAEDSTFKTYPLNRDLYDPTQSINVNESEFNVAFGSMFT